MKIDVLKTIKHNPLLSSQYDRPVFSLKEENIEQTDGCLKYEKKLCFHRFSHDAQLAFEDPQ